MSDMLVVIAPNGTMDVTEEPHPPTLELVQKLVEGYVELVTNNATWDGAPAQVYVNEEGKLRGLKTNTAGTFYVREHLPHFADVLVGNVVVLVGNARWR